MKTIILIILLLIPSISEARDFTVTIPDVSLTSFAGDFLVALPIPTDSQGVPLYTAAQWIRKCVVDYLNNKRQEGKISNSYIVNRPPRTDDVQ